MHLAGCQKTACTPWTCRQTGYREAVKKSLVYNNVEIIINITNKFYIILVIFVFICFIYAYMLKISIVPTSKLIAYIFLFTSSCFFTFFLKVEFFMLLSFFPSPWETGYKKTCPESNRATYINSQWLNNEPEEEPGKKQPQTQPRTLLSCLSFFFYAVFPTGNRSFFYSFLILHN